MEGGGEGGGGGGGEPKQAGKQLDFSSSSSAIFAEITA